MCASGRELLAGRASDDQGETVGGRVRQHTAQRFGTVPQEVPHVLSNRYACRATTNAPPVLPRALDRSRQGAINFDEEAGA
eukprot:7710456-Lingulodinium_polyedra.AAC.1